MERYRPPRCPVTLADGLNMSLKDWARSGGSRIHASIRWKTRDFSVRGE
jgi:hypothetical protein